MFVYFSQQKQLVRHYYVGAIVFFFEVYVYGARVFLVMVDTAESNGVADEDDTIPTCVLRYPGQHKFVVCRFEEIVCNVGLVRYNQNGRQFKVVSHHLFTESLSSKMGQPTNL